MAYTFEVRSDLAVVGYNAENADLDRPNGEVIAERYYMLATDADGATKQWGWYSTPEQLERAFEFVAPSVDEWDEGRPRYGSKAWQDAGQDELDAYAERRAYDVAPGLRAGAFDRVY